jgi:hypothetical protein
VKLTHYFIDRESGQTIRIEKVDERFASVTVVKRLPSTWMMPLDMYDTVFVERYLPLDVGDMAMPDLYRLPANAAYWDEEKARAEAEAKSPQEAREEARYGEDEPVAPRQGKLTKARAQG